MPDSLCLIRPIQFDRPSGWRPTMKRRTMSLKHQAHFIELSTMITQLGPCNTTITLPRTLDVDLACVSGVTFASTRLVRCTITRPTSHSLAPLRHCTIEGQTWLMSDNTLSITYCLAFHHKIPDPPPRWLTTTTATLFLAAFTS